MNPEEYQQHMDAHYFNQLIAEEFYYDIVTKDEKMMNFYIWHDLPAAVKNTMCKMVDELRNYIKHNCTE
jgi:hypothetical protein